MSIEKSQLELAATLRRLRERAGYPTGKAFAEAIGWVASKVSRLENGRTLPSDADITAWVKATNGTDDELVALRSALLDLRLDRDRWKQRLRRGHAAQQRATAAAERDATTITMVELFLVPGLVQIEPYARTVFELAAELHGTPADTDDAVRERIRRQDVLYDSTKSVTVLMSEFALRSSRPIWVLLGQTDVGDRECAAPAGGVGFLRAAVAPCGWPVEGRRTRTETGNCPVSMMDRDPVARTRL